MSIQQPKKEPGIRKSYIPDEKEENVLEHTYTRFSEMADAREEFEDEWDQAMKSWECWRPPKNTDDWMSDIYIGVVTSTVEATMAEIVNQDLKPWAIERGSEDKPRATVMNNILEYTWDIAKSDVASFEIIKDAIICGTGIGQEYFWKNEREIQKPDGTTVRKTEYEDCYLEPVSLWDFYKDEKGRSFSGPFECRDAIRRYIMHKDDFHNFFKGKTWDPLGNAKLVVPGGDVNYYQFFKPPEGFDKSKDIEVLWYWNKPDDALCIVANDVVIRYGPNPYEHKQLPFARAIDVRRPYQFYGKGEYKLLESIQEETNTLRRMLIDRNHLDIDKPILVSDQLTIEDEDVIARPHGVIPVGDVNQAKFAEYGDVPMSYFKSLELINEDKMRITGMDERQLSVNQAGTATEAAILKEATLKRLNMKIWQIKNDFLVDVGKLRCSNIIQFYPQPKLEKIVGEKGTEDYRSKVADAARQGTLVSMGGSDYKANYRKIRVKNKKLSINPSSGNITEQPTKGFTFFDAKPEYFMPAYGGYDIRYKATSSLPISKPLQQQKTMEMYDRLATNPTVDPWKLASKVIEEMEWDPDDFKMTPKGQGDQSGVFVKKLVDLAGIENDEMMSGKQIGPTPYAAPFHTEIHIEFMRSKRFKEEVPPDSNILETFTTHVMGELIAEQTRGGASSGQQFPPGAEAPPGQEGQPTGATPQEMGMPAPSDGTSPGMVQGGDQVPNAAGGLPSSAPGRNL